MHAHNTLIPHVCCSIVPEVADIDLSKAEPVISNAMILNDSRSISFYTPVDDVPNKVKVAYNKYMNDVSNEYPPHDLGSNAL
jgi:hypothetical protein